MLRKISSKFQRSVNCPLLIWCRWCSLSLLCSLATCPLRGGIYHLTGRWGIWQDWDPDVRLWKVPNSSIWAQLWLVAWILCELWTAGHGAASGVISGVVATDLAVKSYSPDIPLHSEEMYPYVYMQESFVVWTSNVLYKIWVCIFLYAQDNWSGNCVTNKLVHVHIHVNVFLCVWI